MKEDVTEKDVLKLLEIRINSLKSELQRTEEAFFALKGKSTAEFPSNYDPDHKWDKKILFILSKIGTAYKEDIVKEINTLESSKNPDKLINLIGVKLSALLKQGVIKAEREGRRFKYYV